MGPDAWVTAGVGLLGAFAGGAAVYASVSARLAVLEANQKAMATAQEKIGTQIVELLKAVLQSPPFDRRHLPRGDPG